MGNSVGELARERWPNGRLIEEPYTEHDQAVATTQALLAAPAPSALFEAAFTYENIRVRVDVLAPNAGGGFDLIEVKASSRVRPQFITDAAIQTYVVEGSRVAVDRVLVMHPGIEYFQKARSQPPRFILDDVTDSVRSYLAKEFPTDLAPMWRVLRQDDPPTIATGPHCDQPNRCPFYGNCHYEGG
ncbi:MAG: hypothetical protein F4185_01750 [Chloroflexi bacterium]|nr:hypothetical protein [Chloroflexota bacterium]